MICRTYQCMDCSETFEVTLESGNDGDPACPFCAVEMEWRPGMFSIGGTPTGRAGDETQKILSEDYGLSDFNDRMKEGDVAYKAPPPPSTAEREAHERTIREIVAETAEAHAPPSPVMPNASIWAGAPGGPPVQMIQSAIAGAKGQGPNPMQMLHEGLKAKSSGRMPGFRVVAKG